MLTDFLFCSGIWILRWHHCSHILYYYCLFHIILFHMIIQTIISSNARWYFGLRVIVFNTTFNNISAISWRSVLLVEETRVPGENHWPVTRQTLSHNVVSSTPRLSGIFGPEVFSVPNFFFRKVYLDLKDQKKKVLIWSCSSEILVKLVIFHVK